MRTEELLSTAEKAVEEANQANSQEQEAAVLKAKIESLTAHLDRMYMDRLSGILEEQDFECIYQRAKQERAALEQKLSSQEAPTYEPEKQKKLARELVNRFVDGAW